MAVFFERIQTLIKTRIQTLIERHKILYIINGLGRIYGVQNRGRKKASNDSASLRCETEAQMTRRQLTPGVLTGLGFLYKYRFLTIGQFSKIAGLHVDYVGKVLRDFERWGLIGYFGFTAIPGQGKTPKVYFMKRKGWEVLCNEADITGEFSEVSQDISWTPQMYHRLRIIDMLIGLELSLRTRPHLHMVNVLVEYRMVKRGRVMVRETTDFVDAPLVSENKLVPDAVFVLENVEAQRRRLYFLEVDLGTERVSSPVTRDSRGTVKHKISQYDRYLLSRRYVQKYSAYGEFSSFTLLFVTISDERIDNIRRETQGFSPENSAYFRFTTFAEAEMDFLGAVWKSRSISDAARYALVRERNPP